MLDPNDGGVASRKLWFAVGTASVMVICWVVTALHAALTPTYDTLLGGLLAVLGLYLTGNISSRWITAKNNPSVSFKDESPEGESKSKVEPKSSPKPVKKPSTTEEGG
jgi:cytochrome c biogenesis protein CcdA